jgi:hypothetical protein
VLGLAVTVAYLVALVGRHRGLATGSGVRWRDDRDAVG